MTNISKNKQTININDEIVAYLKANTSVIEDLIKQMIHQNSETKDYMLRMDNFLENSNEMNNLIKKFQEEINNLNTNVTTLLSTNNSLSLEEDKSNLNTSIKNLTKFFENNNFSKKEIQITKDDSSNLILQLLLQLQQQQQQQITILQQQILQQNNLTITFKEIIDNGVLKIFQQLNREGHCHCMLNNAIFQAFKDNVTINKKETTSKEHENNNYSIIDVVIFEVSCFILGIVLYLIIIDML